MKMTHWDHAIVQTLAYVDQFQYPLSEEEIRTRLVEPSPLHPQLPTQLLEATRRREVTIALNRLIKAGLVLKFQNWYYLAGNPTDIRHRQTRAQLSQAKWREVADFISLVSWIPWITGVAVTGSLAMNNVVVDDDCDFLIVTQPRRLWVSRLAVMAIALVKGKRRSWSGEEKNSWCFNLWLDQNHLAMPSENQNVYGAYEVIQARWVRDTAAVERSFIKANEWIKKYLPYAVQKLPSLHASLKPQPTNLFHQLGDVIDKIVFDFQFWYMKPHMTRERVARGFAFFHPRDTKVNVTTAWQTRISQTVKQPRLKTKTATKPTKGNR